MAGRTRGSGLVVAACSAGAMAQVVTGTYNLHNGFPEYNLAADPSSTTLAVDGSSVEIWSRPLVPEETGDPSQTAGAWEFTLDTPVPFGWIKSITADYQLLSGFFQGGSPRYVFNLDADNNGSVDSYAVLDWQLTPLAGGDTSPGFHPTGNLIGVNTNEFEWASGVPGNYLDYSTVLPYLQNSMVKGIDVAWDSGWVGSPQGIQLANLEVTIPEPASIGLLGLGGLLMIKRRRTA